jgi:DNA-binding PadR family transcriptional regulator
VISDCEVKRLAALAILLKEPMHGYALHQAMVERGVREQQPANTGGLYRMLARMAKENLVSSYWQTPGKGPAQRTFEVTREGKDYFARSSPDVKRAREAMSWLSAATRSDIA